MTEAAAAPSMDVAKAWRQAKGAAEAHPREEHLVPFFVALGASRGEPGARVLDGWMATHFSLASFMFGGGHDANHVP